MRRLAILGASGHGKVVAESALAAGWQEVLFFDDAWPSKQAVGRVILRGDTKTLLKDASQFDGVVVAIGSNEVRLKKLSALRQRGAVIVSIVHPAAIISPSARLDAGSVVMAGAIVNADAIIGRGAILNTACSVDHDCVLGQGVHISPGARLAGSVQVGDRTWVGIGAVVRQGIQLGADVIVGAGSVVVKDVTAGHTVLGVSAKPLSEQPLIG
ncbi:MAG: acetyltransferase [Alcaligenaceae bacterium]|nr:acetyltransferase [Alcaligenaceae bacterium]